MWLEGGHGNGLSWLVGVLRDLGKKLNVALWGSDGTDGLFVDETALGERVLAGRVQWVGRKLQTARLTSLDEVSILVTGDSPEKITKKNKLVKPSFLPHPFNIPRNRGHFCAVGRLFV